MENTKQAEVKVKPISSNAFVAFWQRIWRWWLGVWYGFAEKHPKLAPILYKVFFFIVFSEGVTIWQFLVMTFLPYAFHGLWQTPFVWPAIQLGLTDSAGNALNWAIFNEPVKFIATATGSSVLCSTAADVAKYASDTANYTLQCAGLGNFIAFEIAVFTAQCINFPLQRNITYKSKGNPVFQGFMYFVGWVAISILVNAVWGIMNPLMMSWNWNDVIIGLIKTVLTGGLSMVVFFFIFLVIFPDLKKAAATARKKADAAKAAGAANAAELELKAVKAEEAYKLDEARKNVIATSSTADSKATVWAAAKAKGLSQDTIDEKYAIALEAAEKRDAAIAENEKVKAEVEAARKARA